MTQVNFQGKFISHINIKRTTPSSSSIKASIVELNPVDNSDLKVLHSVHNLWQTNFSNNIYRDALSINYINIADTEQKFYILTMQSKNFNKLRAEDILAESKIITNKPNKDSIYLDYLQVHPENMSESENKIYKGLGSNFLDFLKKHYNGKEINLHSLYTTIEFYLKNGFHQIASNSNQLYYRG